MSDAVRPESSEAAGAAAPRATAPGAALTRAERIYSMAGVMLAMLLAALDQTIVSTAGPAIQRDLRIPAASYAWITTAYLVASTVMVPIYGKLSDRIGRKQILLTGVGIFLAGSLLCGLAQSATALIVFRAVQGLGAAALFTSAFAVIADLFPPAVRGRYTGLIGGTMGIASVVGPLVGGFLTDNFGWHWVFFVNLPVGAVAVWFITTRMPRLGGQHPDDRERIDLPGAAWLVVGVVPLLVALSLGRAHAAPGAGGYAWGSWQIVTMLSIAAVAIAAFLRTERRAADPILHLEIFRNSVIRRSTLAVFVMGAAFLSAVVFLPLYLVNVVGVSATRAGLTMMPLTLGVVAGSITSGQIVARVGRWKPLLVGSLCVLLAGFAVMGFSLSPDATQTEMTLKMILVGLGVGPSLPLYTLASQNSAALDEIGVVTAASTFARSLGQVIGVAVLGTVFASVLTSAMARDVGRALATVPPDVRALIMQQAPRGGAAGNGEAGAVAAFDTALVKARIRQSIAAGSNTASAAFGSHAVVPDAGAAAAGRAPGAAEVRLPPRVGTGAAAPPTQEQALATVDAVSRGFRQAFTDAIEMIYRVGLAMVALAFVITLAIPELPLRRTHERVVVE